VILVALKEEIEEREEQRQARRKKNKEIEWDEKKQCICEFTPGQNMRFVHFRAS
jgi:hypothetical protein